MSLKENNSSRYHVGRNIIFDISKGFYPKKLFENIFDAKLEKKIILASISVGYL